MKAVPLKTIAFQGDLAVERVDALPPDAVETGSNIVARSETSHHHVALRARVFTVPDGQTLYLKALGRSIDIEHQRSFDRHERLRLKTKPGDIIRVRRQREYTPEGWRQVAD